MPACIVGACIPTHCIHAFLGSAVVGQSVLTTCALLPCLLQSTFVIGSAVVYGTFYSFCCRICNESGIGFHDTCTVDEQSCAAACCVDSLRLVQRTVTVTFLRLLALCFSLSQLLMRDESMRPVAEDLDCCVSGTCCQAL